MKVNRTSMKNWQLAMFLTSITVIVSATGDTTETCAASTENCAATTEKNHAATFSLRSVGESEPYHDNPNWKSYFDRQNDLLHIRMEHIQEDMYDTKALMNDWKKARTKDEENAAKAAIVKTRQERIAKAQETVAKSLELAEAIKDGGPLDILDASFGIVGLMGPEAAAIGTMGSTIVGFFKKQTDMTYEAIKAMRSEMNSQFEQVHKEIREGFTEISDQISNFLADNLDEIDSILNRAMDNMRMSDIEDRLLLVETKLYELESVDIEDYDTVLADLRPKCFIISDDFSTLKGVVRRVIKQDAIVEHLRSETIIRVIDLATRMGTSASSCFATQTDLFHAREALQYSNQVISYAMYNAYGTYIHNFGMEAEVLREYGAFEKIEVILDTEKTDEEKEEPTKRLSFMVNPNVSSDAIPLGYNQPYKPFPPQSEEDAMENITWVPMKADRDRDEESTGILLPFETEKPPQIIRLNTRKVTVVIQPRGFDNVALFRDLDLICNDKEQILVVGQDKDGDQFHLKYQNTPVDPQHTQQTDKLIEFTKEFRFRYTCGFGISPVFKVKSGDHHINPPATWAEIDKGDSKELKDYYTYRHWKSVQGYLTKRLQDKKSLMGLKHENFGPLFYKYITERYPVDFFYQSHDKFENRMEKYYQSKVQAGKAVNPLDLSKIYLEYTPRSKVPFIPDWEWDGLHQYAGYGVPESFGKPGKWVVYSLKRYFSHRSWNTDYDKNFWEADAHEDEVDTISMLVHNHMVDKKIVKKYHEFYAGKSELQMDILVAEFMLGHAIPSKYHVSSLAVKQYVEHQRQKKKETW